MAEEVPYDPSPPHSNAFGPAEQADETRQAQQQAANDVPVDVNPNAIIARTQSAGFVEQQGTLTLMGKNFEAGASRRNALFDHFGAIIAGGVKVSP
jgi:hypothetical protein